MKIYDFVHAPNPKKLRIYLAEKGLSIPMQGIDLTAGENRTAEFLAKNPMGSLPVLELDDGQCLTESLAIIEYLEELYPDPPMIGQTPLERARTRELERLIEMSIFGRIGRIFFHTSPVFKDAKQVPAIAELARDGLPGALGIVDRAIGDNPFAAGDTPSIADCTLYAGLELGGRIGLGIEPAYANLNRWHEGFSRRPSAGA